MALNEVFKRRWIARLRSGKYKQCKSSLANVNHTKHCCLGVGWEVIAKKITDYAAVRGTISDAMADKVGLTEKMQNKLTALNDGKNYSFDKIANYIERYY